MVIKGLKIIIITILKLCLHEDLVVKLQWYNTCYWKIKNKEYSLLTVNPFFLNNYIATNSESNFLVFELVSGKCKIIFYNSFFIFCLRNVTNVFL